MGTRTCRRSRRRYADVTRPRRDASSPRDVRVRRRRTARGGRVDLARRLRRAAAARADGVRAAGAAARVPVGPPAARATRLVFGGAGIALAGSVSALLAEWSQLSERWPWPLPPLPAACWAAGCARSPPRSSGSPLREREWARVRIGDLPAIVSLGLDPVAAVRFRRRVPRGASDGRYLALVAACSRCWQIAAYFEERRTYDPPRCSLLISWGDPLRGACCQRSPPSARVRVQALPSVRSEAPGSAAPVSARCRGGNSD